MPDLKQEAVERYLQSVFGAPVSVKSMAILGKDRDSKDLKGYGYGVPLKVEFQIGGKEGRTAVLHSMTPGRFGHEHMADRAQELLWANQAFNRLPRHVRSLDVCGFQPDGYLISAGKIEE